MLRNILLIIITCCIASTIIGQTRQKVEFRTVSVHHLIVDTLPAKDKSDLASMDIHGKVETVKQSTTTYANGHPSAVKSESSMIFHFDEMGNKVQETNNALVEADVATETRNNVYAYNKLQEVVYYDAQGKEASHIKYRYNSRGDVLQCDTLTASGAKPAYVFKYDRFHNIVYEKNFTSDANAYEFTFNYTYDSQVPGRILSKSVDRRHLRSGETYNYTTTYTYNDCGKVTQELVAETNGNQSYITYNYNDCDQLVCKNMQFPEVTLREEYTRDMFNSVVATYYYANNQLQSKCVNDITYKASSTEAPVENNYASNTDGKTLVGAGVAAYNRNEGNESGNTSARKKSDFRPIF